MRHAAEPDGELVPYPEPCAGASTLAGRAGGGRRPFGPEQRWWLDRIAAHIGVNLTIAPDDLEDSPFFDKGGRMERCRSSARSCRYY